MTYGRRRKTPKGLRKNNQEGQRRAGSHLLSQRESKESGYPHILCARPSSRPSLEVTVEDKGTE